MKIKNNIKISAPATISNIGPSLNSLALAIDSLKDEIFISKSTIPGVHITEIINNKTKISLSNLENVTGRAAELTLNYLKENFNLPEDLGFDIRIHKKIPIGCGLGSSSASASAGAVAINEVLSCPLEKQDLVPFIQEAAKLAKDPLMMHNLAASLNGGLMLISTNDSIIRLPIQKGFHVALVYNIGSNSKPAKKELLDLDIQSNLIQTTKCTANMGTLVHALYTGNIDLLQLALKEQQHANYWGKKYKLYDSFTDAALKYNAIGFGVSGQGNTFYALCKNSLDAENITKQFEQITAPFSRYYKQISSPINLEGAQKE